MSGHSKVDDSTVAATAKATAPATSSQPVTRRSPSPSGVSCIFPAFLYDVLDDCTDSELDTVQMSRGRSETAGRRHGQAGQRGPLPELIISRPSPCWTRTAPGACPCAAWPTSSGRPQRPLHPRARQERPGRGADRPGLRRPRAWTSTRRPTGPSSWPPSAATSVPTCSPTPPWSPWPSSSPAWPARAASGRGHLPRAAPGRFPDQAVSGPSTPCSPTSSGSSAPEVPRAGTDPQTSDEFVRRLHGFFAALPPGEFPHTVDWPRCWPASPPTTSSSSASAPSSPVRGPGRP